MKRILFSLFMIFTCAMCLAETAGLRDYYYFYCEEDNNELYVVHVNELGQVLAPPAHLNAKATDGVALTHDSSGRIVVITNEVEATGTGVLRRYIFTPPATLTGGSIIRSASNFAYNVSATDQLPGALLGSDEETIQVGFHLTSTGAIDGRAYRPVPRLDDIYFVDVRADGKEAVALSTCCGSLKPIVLQKLNSLYQADGDPIYVDRLNASLGAARLSADGNSLLIAGTGTSGLWLYRLDPNTRKPRKTTAIAVSGETGYYDASAINENGTFFIIPIDESGTVKIYFQQTDGLGNLVGKAKVLFTLTDRIDHADLVRAN